jgi:hypothetical protein
MRQGQFKNRSRNRGNRRPSSPLSRVYESNGPDVKVRGTAQHVAEKYLQLARDAQASGDSVMGESYYQHAEHYLRIVAAAQSYQQQHGPQPHSFQSRRPDEEDMYEDGDDAGGSEDAPQTAGAEQPRIVEAEIERHVPVPPAAPPPPPAQPSEARSEAGDGKKWDGHQPDFLRRTSPASNGGGRPRRGRRPSSQAQAAEAAPAQEGGESSNAREAPESVG